MEKQIVFKSKKQRFSLPIDKIERIVEWQKPIAIPESSLFILGVIQYNQQILPIIDLSYRLYQTVTTIDNQSKIIVVLWKNKLIGIVVEEINGINDFDEEQCESIFDELTIDKEYINNFIKTNQDIIIQLEIDTLFHGDIHLDTLPDELILSEKLMDFDFSTKSEI